MLIWVALALLASHALAGAVVVREPGADLGRHLAEARVSTAVLAPAAIAGTRLRAGAVGAISWIPGTFVLAASLIGLARRKRAWGTFPCTTR